MPTQAYMKVLPRQQLAPASEHEEEILEPLKVGEIVRIDVFQQRSYGNHARFMAMLRKAHSFEQVRKVYPAFEPFRAAITVAAGYFDLFPGWDPKTGAAVELIRPKSVSFGSMTEVEFRDLFSKAIDVILGKCLHGQDSEELEDQFMQILEFDG